MTGVSETASGSRAWRSVGRLATGWVGTVAVGAWALGEAIVLPVVPDVLLYPLAAAVPRRAAWLFGAVLGGALIGTAILYATTLADPELGRSLVLAVPGIDREMLDAATASTASGDPTSMVVFGVGTPLKVFTVGWETGSGDLVGLAVGTVLNRLARIGPGVVAAAMIGLLAPRWLERHGGPILVVYALAWTVFYAFFLGSG